MNIDKDKAAQSARENGMDLEGSPVAYEFYNPATGHAVVDYTRWTHVGHLREEDGYIARPLVYADGVVVPPHQTVCTSDADGGKDEQK